MMNFFAGNSKSTIKDEIFILENGIHVLMYFALIQFNWGASFWTNDEETFMNLYWALVGETISLANWCGPSDFGVLHHRTLATAPELYYFGMSNHWDLVHTIGLWRNHWTLESHCILEYYTNNISSTSILWLEIVLHGVDLGHPLDVMWTYLMFNLFKSMPKRFDSSF